MDEFTDADIELTIEPEDNDTRVTLTVVRLDGKPLSFSDFVFEVEGWLSDIKEAEKERLASGAVNQ